MRLYAGIQVFAPIRIWPTVEATGGHARHVVGYEVVAEHVALIDRSPKLPGVGIELETGAVADAGRKYVRIGAIRIELPDRSAPPLCGHAVVRDIAG